jgi:hypothetical protein
VVAQAIGGGLEEVGEESAAFAEDAAEDFRNRKHILAMWDGVADVGGDPFGGLAGAALVAGGADVAGFAGEGEEALVSAVGALVAGEAGGEVATTVVGLDGGDGFRAEGTHGRSVMPFVGSQEVIPGGVDDLPERGGAGAAGLVNGRHNCSIEQLWRGNVGHKFVETLFASLDFAGSWELKSCRTGSVRLFDELNHQLKQAVSMVTPSLRRSFFARQQAKTPCQRGATDRA